MHTNQPLRASLLLACLCFAACATAQSPPANDGVDAQPRRGERYQNNYFEVEPKGFVKLLQWRFEALQEGLPPPPREPVPAVEADVDFIGANAGARQQPAVTWIGHASALLQLAGLNVLTDPIFSERASPFSFIGPQRAQPPGLTLATLPRIDAVLISHNHYDHLDLPSLMALNAQPGGAPLFIVPLGVKALLNGEGIHNVIELGWWQAHHLGTLEIVMTPVQHWSGRSFNDRMQTLWGGYALFAPELHVFFSGDTGYSKDFADIRARFASRHGAQHGGGFDLALIAIGGYEPRWFMRDTHVNPAEAVQVHLDLGARRSIGVHWGTFELTDEALDEPPRALAAARRAMGIGDDEFTVLPIGGTQRLQRRGSGAAVAHGSVR
jgi:N-acyl-phosphatidylethanolamine-hydrolysing phospholipase D